MRLSKYFVIVLILISCKSSSFVMKEGYMKKNGNCYVPSMEIVHSTYQLVEQQNYLKVNNVFHIEGIVYGDLIRQSVGTDGVYLGKGEGKVLILYAEIDKQGFLYVKDTLDVTNLYGEFSIDFIPNKNYYIVLEGDNYLSYGIESLFLYEKNKKEVEEDLYLKDY